MAIVIACFASDDAQQDSAPGRGHCELHLGICHFATSASRHFFRSAALFEKGLRGIGIRASGLGLGRGKGRSGSF